MRWGLRLAMLVGALLALGAVPAQAQQVRDQEQTVATEYASVSQDVSRAQVFTAGRTGGIDRIDLFLYRGADTTAPLTVEIRDAPGGSPGSTVLASANLTPADVPNGEGAAAFVPITFSPGAPVVAGSQYAIVLYSTAPPTLETRYHWGRAGGLRPLPPRVDVGYAGGNSYSSATTPPSEWVDLFLADQAFVTYVTVAPVGGGQVSLPAVVRSSTTWLLRDSLTSGPPTREFAYRADAKPLVPFTGDWEGSGSETPGTFERGVFRLSNTIPPSEIISITFGDPRGFPVAGDFDRDGRDDVAIYRNGTWQIRFADDGTTETFSFGSGLWPSTVPVAGDWDGDGTDGIGTYTLATGTWDLRQTASSGAADAGSFVFWTGSGSYPVVGDWEGSGSDTVGVKKGTIWSLNNQNDTSDGDITFEYGLANDLPLTWKPAPTPDSSASRR